MRDEPEIFVSRHGRKTKLDNVDLKDLSIDEQPVNDRPVATQEKPEPPVAKKPPKADRSWPAMPKATLSKKTWGIIFGTALILLVAPVVLLELVALQYKTSAEGLKSEVRRVGQEIALPEQKKTPLSTDAISKTVRALSSARDGSCKGGLMDNLANLYPRSKDALAECARVNGKVSGLINALGSLQAMQAYGVAAETALRPALAASDSPYAVIGDQLTSWQTASGKVGALNPPSSLNGFHAALKQITKDITTQWSALNSANNAQDEAAFREAETKLGNFYATMRELSAALIETQQKAQADVNQAATQI